MPQMPPVAAKLAMMQQKRIAAPMAPSDRRQKPRSSGRSMPRRYMVCAYTFLLTRKYLQKG
jgi:hypothetical protein